MFLLAPEASVVMGAAEEAALINGGYYVKSYISQHNSQSCAQDRYTN